MPITVVVLEHHTIFSCLDIQYLSIFTTVIFGTEFSSVTLKPRIGLKTVVCFCFVCKKDTMHVG